MERRTWTERYALIRIPFCRTVSEELVEDHGAYLRAAPGLKVLLGYFLQTLPITGGHITKPDDPMQLQYTIKELNKTVI